jgi:hypothetical protein
MDVGTKEDRVRSQDRDLLVEGPLAIYAVGYEEELCRLGYHSRQVCRHVALLSELSGWMEHRGLVVEQLCAEQLEKFFRGATPTGVRLVGDDSMRRGSGRTVAPTKLNQTRQR